MPEMIRKNPAEASFRDAIVFAADQRRAGQGEKLRQQTIDTGDRAQRLDKTLAREMAGTPGTAGALAREGFGGEAMAMKQQQDTGNLEHERNAMIALASYGKTGNPAELQNFNMLSQRAGLQVPPEVLADTKQAGLFAHAALISEKSYSDPRQAVIFTRAYVQSGGDMEKAATVAGPPTDKPNWTVRNVIRNGQQVIALVDSVSGGVKFPTYQGPGGQPEMVQTPAPAGGSGGRPPAKIQAAEWLTRNGVAKDANEAWSMVNSAVTNPMSVRKSVFTSVYNNLVRNFIPHDEAVQLANEVTAQFMAEAGAGDTGMEPQPQAPPAQQQDDWQWYNPSTWGGGSTNAAPAPNGLGQAPAAPAAPPAPVAPPAPAAPQQFNEGQTAINPQTGQRMIFRGGQWQPI